MALRGALLVDLEAWTSRIIWFEDDVEMAKSLTPNYFPHTVAEILHTGCLEPCEINGL